MTVLPIRNSFVPGLLLVIAACAGSGEILNSERIENRFGSYGVEVLEQTRERRIASLYSGEGASRITRTYALVDYAGGPNPAIAREHEKVRQGGSIGATFTNAGWTVRKQSLFIGELEVPPSYSELGALMNLWLPQTLAVHQYLLVVSKDRCEFDYAVITEVHHPDYLSVAELRSLYGEILLDDSNRDAIHDFLGAPRTK